MADAVIPISQLPTASYIGTTDIFPIVQGGVTKSVAFNILNGVPSGNTLASTIGTTDLIPIIQNGLGRQATAQRLGSAIVQTIQTFLQSGTGAIAEAVQSALRWHRSITNFMSDADRASLRAGSAVNIDTALANAITAMPSGGGELYFPEGTYTLSSAGTLSKPGTYYGTGEGTVIQTTSATADIFDVTVGFVTICDMKFDTTVTRTGGNYVDLASTADRFRLMRCHMNAGFQGVRIVSGCATVTIEDVMMLSFVATTGIGVRIDGGTDISINNLLMDTGGSEPFAGIYIVTCDDVAIDNCQLINAGQALYINPGSSQVAVSVHANNSFFDNSTRGVFLEAAGGTIARCTFNQCYIASHTVDGVTHLTSSGGVIEGIDFTACHVFLNAAQGIQIGAGSTNIRIHDCSIAGNTNNGVNVAAAVSELSIQNNRIGDSLNMSGNANGIVIAAGAGNNIQILNNDLRGNTSAALTQGATGASVIVDNNLGANEAWTTYTPTAGSGTGTVTTFGTVSGRHQKIGKSLFLQLSIAITTNGTGATSITATLPSGLTAAAGCVIAGRETVLTGNMLQGVVPVTSGTVSITNYDNSYPGGDGRTLVLTGVIEVA